MFLSINGCGRFTGHDRPGGRLCGHPCDCLSALPSALDSPATATSFSDIAGQPHCGDAPVNRENPSGPMARRTAHPLKRRGEPGATPSCVRPDRRIGAGCCCNTPRSWGNKRSRPRIRPGFAPEVNLHTPPPAAPVPHTRCTLSASPKAPRPTPGQGYLAARKIVCHSWNKSSPIGRPEAMGCNPNDKRFGMRARPKIISSRPAVHPAGRWQNWWRNRSSRKG